MTRPSTPHSKVFLPCGLLVRTHTMPTENVTEINSVTRSPRLRGPAGRPASAAGVPVRGERTTPGPTGTGYRYRSRTDLSQAWDADIQGRPLRTYRAVCRVRYGKAISSYETITTRSICACVRDLWSGRDRDESAEDRLYCSTPRCAALSLQWLRLRSW